MKKFVAIICLLLVFSSCSNKQKALDENSKTLLSSEIVKTEVDPPADKLGFTSKCILDSDFNELIEDKFSIINTQTMESGSKVEVLSNEYKVVKILLFTNKDEDIPSAFAVTAPEKSNSTIDKKYDDIITVLRNSVPEESQNFITEFDSIIDKNKFTTLVFYDEFLQSDLETFYKEFLEQYKIKPKNTEKEEELPVEYAKALSSAKKYLKVSSFSKNKLKNQLLYEKFSEEAANYAVDNITADWHENAIKSAEKYLKLSDFSKERLYDQLIHDEYTEDEAKEAVEKVF